MITREGTQKILKTTLALLAIALVVGYTLFASRDFIRGPDIVIKEPVNGSTLATSSVLVVGQALRIQKIELNNRPILIDKEGNFKETILLLPGYNSPLFTASDKFGRKTEYKLELIYMK
ncbi:MAG: hypothetical protein V4697_04040 [Patescibacteria group bacterium]